MAARVDDVEARGDDADDPAAGLERALVRGGVDADRQAAHDRDALLGQVAPDRARVGDARRCRGARADDGDSRPVEHVGPLAFGEQHRGRLSEARGSIGKSGAPVDPHARRAPSHRQRHA